MLRRTYDAIKTVAPENQVLLGGITTRKASRDWLARVFATPAADAAHRFDIANIHLRGGLNTLTKTMARVRAQFAHQHFRGRSGSPNTATRPPPATNATLTTKAANGHRPATCNSRYQCCFAPAPSKSSSPYATAPRLEFGDSKFASEGVLRPASDEPYPVRRKRSYWLVRRLAGLSPATPATARK